ncbi:MAG: iron-containing alcohol dehydrogenase, partial [Betaproteobacteria bacterium]|nr:iron-containing alcohol dehydrogenase [Betaproteobacteria bacterium]NDF18740.1 iron-containing alcohol dehydrogenase [Betaproteobacteria bacterium]
MPMHEFLAQDRVIWAEPAEQAVLAEVQRRAANRVFVVTGKTINRETPLVKGFARALGERFVGCFDQCVEHTPRRTVIEAARAVRQVKPDLIVSVGGGTVIDTVKVLLIALAQQVEHEDELSAWHLGVNPDGSRKVPAIKSPPVRQIAVSTTLSAAEFSNLGGCTDEKRQVKDAYMGAEIGPATVILDAQASLFTPSWLWLSTGIRALDHAIEGLCSISPSPFIHALGLEAVRLLSR